MFSHMFLLFQLLLSYSSIFAKSLLTNFFAPFLAARESNFSSRFLYHWHSKLVHRTERMGFSKQDTHGNLVVASLPVTFPLSTFRQRFLVQTSVGLNANHTFLTHQNPQTDTFFHDLGLAKLHSTAWVWNPQGISKLVNKVDCRLSYDSFLAFFSR